MIARSCLFVSQQDNGKKALHRFTSNLHSRWFLLKHRTYLILEINSRSRSCLNTFYHCTCKQLWRCLALAEVCVL